MLIASICHCVGQFGKRTGTARLNGLEIRVNVGVLDTVKSENRGEIAAGR